MAKVKRAQGGRGEESSRSPIEEAEESENHTHSQVGVVTLVSNYADGWPGMEGAKECSVARR